MGNRPPREGGGIRSRGRRWRCSTTCARAARTALVVSLSGGADSSAVACLVAMMVELGVQRTGSERLQRKAGLLPPTARKREIAGRLDPAACSPASTSRRRTARRRHARCRGARVAQRHRRASSTNSTSSNWCSDYARHGFAGHRAGSWTGGGTIWRCKTSRPGSARPACGCWPTCTQALLLSTSNRSEAAVGYATMDGDTSGGLSPIAGIDKAFLRPWLRWLEATGPAGGCTRFRRWPPSIAQPPTAELRPPGPARPTKTI